MVNDIFELMTTLFAITPKVVSATEIVESRILFRDIALEISLPPSLPERFMHA